MSGEVALGLGLAAVCGAAWRFRWLTAAGGLAALGVGAAVLAGGGPAGLALLALFFVTASALTTWNPARSRPAEVTGESALHGGSEPERRGDAAGRGARQVLANGGVAAGAALLGLAGVLPLAHYAVAGGLAAAAADTWATEVGTAVAGPTRRVGSWERVPSGASGGVSVAGTVAGSAGALLLAAAAALLMTPDGGAPVRGIVGLAVVAAGIVGMAADSLVGGQLEGRVSWIHNDTVNLVATAVGATTAWSLLYLALG